MDSSDNAQPQAPQEQTTQRGGFRGRGQRGGRGRGRGGSDSKPQPKAPSGPTQPIQPAGQVTTGLPPPSNREKNSVKQKTSSTREDAVFKEAVFSAERTLKPVSREIHFTPSSTGFTGVVEDVFMTYRGEKRQQMGKEFPPELFRYYSACLYWLRVIGFKLASGQELSDEEDRVLQSFEMRKLSVPEPIYLALKAIGKVTTATGDVLVPNFPPLPTTETETFPGTLGPVSVANHNTYEELPLIGPTVECMRQRLATNQPNAGRIYESALAPNDTVATTNLQGFARLVNCRMEAIAFLENLGISAEEQFSNILNTGINFRILDAVSEYLATTESFKIYPCGIIEIPETGSVGQTVRAVPEVTELDQTSRANNVYVYMTSMTKESAVTAGVSEVFGLCQYKTQRPAVPEWQGVTPWSAISFNSADAYDNFEGYAASRNLRRNLPDRYTARCFIAAGDWSGDYRKQSGALCTLPSTHPTPE